MSFAAKRTLRRDGVDIRLYRFEAVSTSSKGTHYELEDGGPETIKAIPDPGGRSLGFGPWGVDVDAEQVYLVDAAEPVDDGGGEGASIIEQADNAYRVLDRDVSLAGLGDMGFAVLECERDSTVDLERWST